jgi:hypothetical protein
MDTGHKRGERPPVAGSKITEARPEAAAATIRPTKPANRAFLLQVTDSVEGGEIRGRVQSLATADGGNFSSASALIEILHRVLTDPTNQPED